MIEADPKPEINEEFAAFLEANGLLRQKAKELYRQLSLEGSFEPLEKALRDALPECFRLTQGKFQDKAECRRLLLSRVKNDPNLQSIIEQDLEKAEPRIIEASINLTDQLVAMYHQKKTEKASETPVKLVPQRRIHDSSSTTAIDDIFGGATSPVTPVPKRPAPPPKPVKVPPTPPTVPETRKSVTPPLEEVKETRPDPQLTEKKFAGFVTSNKGKLACIQVIVEERSTDKVRVGDAEARSEAKKKYWILEESQLVDYQTETGKKDLVAGTRIMALYPIQEEARVMSSVFYPGTISLISENEIKVKYDDGDETSTIGLGDFFPISEIRDAKIRERYLSA